MATLRVTNLRGRSANVAPNLTDGVNVTGVGTVSSRLELGASGIGATIHGNGNAVFAGVTTSASFVGPITGDVTGSISGTTGTFSGDVSVVPNVEISSGVAVTVGVGKTMVIDVLQIGEL